MVHHKSLLAGEDSNEGDQFWSVSQPTTTKITIVATFTKQTITSHKVTYYLQFSIFEIFTK